MYYLESYLESYLNDIEIVALVEMLQLGNNISLNRNEPFNH